jgi:putative hydrolase of the HAD superfamily
VERLKDNHRLVLASNTDQIHFAYSVQHFGVLSHFDQHFLSYEMGLLKPDPEFFLRMLRDLGVSPTDCVFIDDVIENVESARGRGISAVQFQSNEGLQTVLAALL